MSASAASGNRPGKSRFRLPALLTVGLLLLGWLAGRSISEDIVLPSRGTLGTLSFEASVPQFNRAGPPAGIGVAKNQFRDGERRRRGPDPQAQANNNSPRQPAPRRPGEVRAKPLLFDEPLAQALSDPEYVSQVGGVAFDQVAQPAAGLEAARLRASYDYAFPDGQRLVLFADGQPCFTSGLPDWHLAPIVHYADSQHTAVVSLFGELDGTLTPERLARVANIVAFHPAFDQTLLGLRLFQTDFMLLDNSLTGELPKFNGRYLLGPGESPPNPTSWQPAADALSDLLDGGKFTSYVICDQAEPVALRIVRDSRQPKVPARVELSGGIQYHFWTSGPRVQVQRGNTLLDTFTVLPVPALTSVIYRSQPLLQQGNPQVYAATTNTLRYAALFRYLKQQDAAAWQKFVEEVDAGIPHSRYAAPTPVLIDKRPGDPDRPLRAGTSPSP